MSGSGRGRAGPDREGLLQGRPRRSFRRHHHQGQGQDRCPDLGRVRAAGRRAALHGRPVVGRRVRHQDQATALARPGHGDRQSEEAGASQRRGRRRRRDGEVPVPAKLGRAASAWCLCPNFFSPRPGTLSCSSCQLTARARISKPPPDSHAREVPWPAT